MKDKLKKVIKNNYKFLLFIIIMTIIINIPLPYYIMAPGGIIDITDRIDIEDKNETKGTLNLLYVTEYEANVGTMIMSYFLKNWDTEKISEVQISDESMEEIAIRNKVMLNNSMQNAILVAYKKAGKDVKIKGVENTVIALTEDNEKVKIGDKILTANGITIDNLNTLKKIINATDVGKTILLEVERNGKKETLEVKVKEKDNAKVIGIVMITNYIYEVSPEIKLSFKNGEGGSSGGLMIALNIYNALTSSDITSGRKIAGTGTIDSEGNVGAIDGIKYKIIGAHENNMEIILVPKDNYEEAIKVNKENNFNMKIVSVETFDDALNYLLEEDN